MSTSVYLHVNMKASQDPPSLSVGELAARFGLPTNVLRHWESVGLLTPRRDASGYRRYGPDDVIRVAVIERNKLAGMNLRQIAALLDGGRHGRREILLEHLRALDERSREIARSRAMTEHALQCRAHDIATCPRFIASVADAVPPSRRRDA